MAILSESVGLVYFAAGLVSLLLSVVGLRRPDSPGSRGFVVFTAGITTWCFTLTVPKFFGSIPYTPGFFYVVMLAAQLGTVGWLLLVFEFSGRWPISRRGYAAIGLFLLIGQLAVWSDPRHELLLGPGTEVSGAILVPELGPVFFTLTAVEYLIIGGCTAIIWPEVRDSTGSRRIQSLVILLGAVPPVLASLVSITEFGATNHDVTPFGFLVSEGLFAWSLYRAQFLEIAPVARKTVVEEMRDAVLTVDGREYLVDYNSTAAELFTLDERAIGRPIQSVITHDGLLDLVTNGESTGSELTIQQEEGVKHVHVTVSSLNVPGATRSRVVVLRDITPLKEREQELRQRESELERQNERLDRFTGLVSHDLRNPLNVASGYLELARQECESEHLDEIRTAHDRMEALLQDLLTLARQGEPIDETERVSLSAVATQSWGVVDTGTGSLTIEDDATFTADSDRLQQLLENLFRNAVEHGSTSSRTDSDDAVEHGSTSPDSQAPQDTVEHGSTSSRTDSDDAVEHERKGVTVRVGPIEDCPGFYVADDGSGIPESDRERIFDSGYSTHEGGTGFGLDIVSEIVDAHGWTIAATDSWDGGARFEITDVDTIGTSAGDSTGEDPET